MFRFHIDSMRALVPCADDPSAAAGVDGDDEVKRLLRPWMAEIRSTSDGGKNYYPSSSSSSGSSESGPGWAGLVLVLVVAFVVIWLGEKLWRVFA